MLSKYRRNRLVNINTNVVIASVLGTALAAFPVHLTKMITHSELAIVAISFFIDGIFDVVIFMGLHILIHKEHIKGLKPSRAIIDDLLKIQSQRVVLSVIYLVFAIGGHYILLIFGVERTIAFIASYLGALVVSRSVHTLYGLKTGLFEKI